MYDPNITGTGHQPHYMDQMVSLGYNKYCVVGSKCIARVYFADISYNQTPLRGCLFIDDTPAVGSKTDQKNMYEDKGCVYKLLNAGQTGQTMRFCKKYSARKYWGCPPMSNNTTHGTFAVNPGTQAYFGFSVQPTTTPPSITTAIAEFFIQYTAVWYQVAETGTS